MGKKIILVYILPLLLIFSFLTLFSVKPASADQTISAHGTTFTITQKPTPVTMCDNSHTITIKATETDFFRTGTYLLIAQSPKSVPAPNNQTTRTFSCQFGSASSNVVCSPSRPDNETLKFELRIRDDGFGSADIGQWKVSLIRNDNGSKDPVFGGSYYNFDMEQCKGGLPQISPLESPVRAGDEIFVILSQARAKTDYTFWWDGDWGILPKIESVPEKADKNIIISLGKDSKKIGVPQTLCMAVGAFHQLPLVGCDFRTQFLFTQNARNTTLQCSIIPTFGATNKTDIGFSAIHLDKNTEYSLTTTGQNRTRTLNHLKSGDSGALIVDIGSNFDNGTYETVLYKANDELCKKTFKVGQNIICKQGDLKCTSSNTESCSSDTSNPGFVTAIGCIHTNPAELTKDIMKFVLGIGGGIAFLMMLLGAFQMLTSGGNPETLNAGRERLTSAVIGLLLIIFAVLLMQIIGVGILKLPGFE